MFEVHIECSGEDKKKKKTARYSAKVRVRTWGYVLISLYRKGS